MEKVKEDILFHESWLNKWFYTNFNQYTSNINNFRWSLIVFSWWLITFLIFFTKDIQNQWILEFCIIFSLIIVFNLSVLIWVVFPILHLKINLYRNYL